MANNTDYTRLLDGYALLAIKNYVDTKIATRAPTSHASSATTYGVGTSANYGHVKLGPAQQYGATAADGVAAPNGHTHSQYLTGQTWREIKVAGTSKIGSGSSAALDFLNGTHSVQFTYSSGLYAEVDLTKYKPNGTTAFLDSSNKVSTSYLPDTVLGQLEYKGTWNATTPASIGTPEKGWYYICTTAGSKNPAGGTVTGVSYAVGDWAVYNGSTWDKVDNTDAITSIKWGTGTAQTGAIAIPYATGSVEGVIKLGNTSTTAAYGNHVHSLAIGSADQTDYYIGLNEPFSLTAGGPTIDIEIQVVHEDIENILGYTPATSGHTHPTVIASESTLASQLTLAFGTKYILATGGTSYVFTMPSNPNTWRAIQVNGTQILSTATNTGVLNLKAGNNVSITNSGGTVTIAATDTTYAIAKYNAAGLLKPLYSNTTAVTATTAAAEVNNAVTVAERTTTAGRYYGVEIDKDGRLYVNVPWSNSDHYPTAFTWTNGTTAGPTGSLTGNSGFTAVSFGAIPSASATQSGIVTIGAQAFKGNKTFYGNVEISTNDASHPDSELVIGHNYSAGKLTIWDGGDGSFVTLRADPNTGFDNNGQILYIPGEESGRTLATREWSNAAYIAKTLTSAKGDMIYASAANTPARLAIGSNGQFLSVNSSGIPAWTSHAVSIATSSGANQITLAYGTKYAITVNGTSYVFTMPASDNTNYYPSRSYTSGLQISSYVGSQSCELYVPYATNNQAGVVSTTAQTFAGLKSFSSGINISDYNIVPRSISGRIACLQLHPFFYGDFGDNLEIYAFNSKGDPSWSSGNSQTCMNLVWNPGTFGSQSFFGLFYNGQTGGLEPESFSPLWLSYDNNVHIGSGTYGNGYLYLHKPGSMDVTSKAVIVNLYGITDNTFKIINPNTFSQQEATNILNGLNSDGTTI